VAGNYDDMITQSYSLVNSLSCLRNQFVQLCAVQGIVHPKIKLLSFSCSLCQYCGTDKSSLFLHPRSSLIIFVWSLIITSGGL